MADIFSTGPTRSGYLSGASNGFLAAKPADQSGMNSFADTLGGSLANIGIGASGIRNKKPTAMEQLQLQEAQAKDAARAQIADIAKDATLDDIQERYTHALVTGARAGVAQDEIDGIFQGIALARGAESNQVGRIGGKRGGYGPDTVFTPDAASGLRKDKREESLADTAAGIAESQRKEGVADKQRRLGEDATTAREREMQGRREGASTALENLRFGHEKELKGAPKPGVALTGVDDLRKSVVGSMSDQLGLLPSREGDLPADQVQADPGVVNDVMARASELMDAPNNMSAIDAINQAVREKADLTGSDKTGGLDLSGIGMGAHIGGNTVKTIKKAAPDPFGIRK